MEFEIFPSRNQKSFPAWALTETGTFFKDIFDPNLEDNFQLNDLLPPWVGTETLLSENLQDFWENPFSCNQNGELTNSLEVNLNSSPSFLPLNSRSTTIQPALNDWNQPNDLLTEDFEDLWKAPLFTGDLSDITDGGLDVINGESFSSSLAFPSPPSSPSPLPLTPSPLLPGSFITQEHDYSLSPSLLPSPDKTKPKLSGGKSILKRATGGIHFKDIIESHKKVQRSSPLNQPKKHQKNYSKKEHNERERCRRDHLKLEFERLREMVPSLEKSKRPPKREILDRAKNYCLTLAARLQTLKKIQNQEKSRHENLKVNIARASETFSPK